VTEGISPLSIEAATASVAARDPVLADFIERSGPYEPRGGEGDYFGSLARAIVYQQLAGRAAAAIHGRVVAAVGGSLTAEAVLQTSVEALRAAGLSAAKAASLLDLATKSTDGTVPLTGIDLFQDEEIIERLSAVRGIGRWSAEMFLIFELRRPDVWPVDDYGVRQGYSLIYSLPEVVKPRDLRIQGERFRPYRSLVALYCWHAVHLHRATATGSNNRRVTAQKRTPSPTGGATETTDG
jgi:DNA-3-methyladenine glycosylase II